MASIKIVTNLEIRSNWDSSSHLLCYFKMYILNGFPPCVAYFIVINHVIV